MEKYDALKLEKQLCFPLYAVSKEIVKKYKPYLDELDLTYTQYITMMVMWEHKEMNVKELGTSVPRLRNTHPGFKKAGTKRLGETKPGKRG